MKHKLTYKVLAFCMIFVLFPYNFSASASTEHKKTGSHHRISTSFGAPNCNIDKNENAPCKVEVFSNSTASLKTLTTTTQVVTCGVNIYTNAGLLVAKIWEDVSVTWDQYGYKITNSTRSTWVATSYGWKNLAGPSPKTASGNLYQTTVISSGTVTWLGGAPYGDHSVSTTVVGNQSNASWNCSGSY